MMMLIIILVIIMIIMVLLFFRKIVCQIMKRVSISVLSAMPFQHHRNYYPLLLYITIYACPLIVVMIVGED